MVFIRLMAAGQTKSRKELVYEYLGLFENGVFLKIHFSIGLPLIICEVKISEIFSGETFSYQIPSGHTRRIGPFLHILKQSAFDLNI